VLLCIEVFVAFIVEKHSHRERNQLAQEMVELHERYHPSDQDEGYPDM